MKHSISEIDFKGKQTSIEVILMVIYWYLEHSWLSYRDIEVFFKDRGFIIDHSSVQRWVSEYSPLILNKLLNRRNKIYGSWSLEETCVKVKGKWYFLYKAVDKYGYIIDFYLSKHKEVESARNFFDKAFKSSVFPTIINTDNYNQVKL